MLIVSQCGERIINHNRIKTIFVEYCHERECLQYEILADEWILARYNNCESAKKALREITEQIIAGAALYQLK